MRSSKIIHTVSVHAQGEVGDVIVGGVAPPPGKTVWEQRGWIEQDETLRNFMLNEPRGGVFRHVNLLVPSNNPKADMGWIIMEPADTPPMSGSNSICVATVLLETGILPMKEGENKLTLEAPGGLVDVVATCKDGQVMSVNVQNHPSFAYKIDVPTEVEGLGTVNVSIAYGGDSFAIIEADQLGFDVRPDEAADIVKMGNKVREAAEAQHGFKHPTQDWNHISFCEIVTKTTKIDDALTARNAVVIRPGKIDRSPCGTGSCAKMAVMHAQGKMKVGDKYIARSIIDSTFHCQIVGTTMLGDTPAIVPTLAGRAFITGTHQHQLNPDDPWPEGYRIGDTWPMA